MSAINRFLGDTPLRVALKLIVVSFLVGIVMAAFGWSAWDVVARVGDVVTGLWNMGFAAIYRFWSYFLLGAAVVVPVLGVPSMRRTIAAVLRRVNAPPRRARPAWCRQGSARSRTRPRRRGRGRTASGRSRAPRQA